MFYNSLMSVLCTDLLPPSLNPVTSSGWYTERQEALGWRKRRTISGAANMKNTMISWFLLPVRNIVMLRWVFCDKEIVLDVLLTDNLMVMLTENQISSVWDNDHTWEDDHAAKIFCNLYQDQNITTDGTCALQLPLTCSLLYAETLMPQPNPILTRLASPVVHTHSSCVKADVTVLCKAIE